MKDIQRLLAGFPPVSGDPALVLHNYLMAAEDWTADQVEDGVTLILKGKLPGHDGRFAPTAPMFAAACRLAAETAARARYLEGIMAPRLPPPDIVHTPEERARAKAQVDAFIAAQAGSTDAVALDAARKAQWAKVNARFMPALDDQSIAERLLGYTVGAPESDENAA